MKTFKSLVERHRHLQIWLVHIEWSLQKVWRKYVKWHSIDPEAGMKHVKRFWRYKSTLDDQFDKLKSSGRKPSDRKRIRKPDFESTFDRLGKKENEIRKSFTSQDPNVPKRYCMSHFSVQWCRALLTNARKL